MGIHIKMFLAPFILGFLLVGTGEARSLSDTLAEKNLQIVINGDQLEVRKTLPQGLEPEERVGGVVTSIALSLILGLIKDMIRDAIFDVLGITTTPPPPGPIVGIIGGILGGGEEESPSSTTPPPGLIEALLGLAFPAPTTTTTTTTAAPCGGVLGLGLLAEPCTEAPTTN